MFEANECWDNKHDPQRREERRVCADCGRDIYPDEKYYRDEILDEILCFECWMDKYDDISAYDFGEEEGDG